MSDSTASDASPAHEDLWRQEVQARVTGYRSRSGRRIEGAFSMRFPFPDADDVPLAELDRTQFAVGPGTLASIEEAVDQVVTAHPPLIEEVAEYAPERREFEEQPGAPTEDQITAQASPSRRPRSKRKIIAFPKPLVVEPEEHNSDFVLPEQPRIYEVPEQLEFVATTPLLDGLKFASHQQQSNVAHTEHVELPLQPASLSQRVYAGIVDGAIVMAAAGLFGAISFKLLPKLTLTKPVLLVAAAIPLLLWTAYQYLLLVYSGQTMGMQMAKVRLCTFKGDVPGKRQRRSRAIGFYFSAASLMMGLLWALVDVDALCWHDRISRTYLATSD